MPPLARPRVLTSDGPRHSEALSYQSKRTGAPARALGSIQCFGPFRLLTSRPVGVTPNRVGSVGIGFGGLAFEFERSLSLAFGFLGVAPGR
jgi:hypothetical protein